MRKIAMVESGDRKHPDEIQSDGDADRDRAPSDPDHSEAHQMNHYERDASKPVGHLRRIGIRRAACRSVKPSCDRNKKSAGFARRPCRHSVSPSVPGFSPRTEIVIMARFADLCE